MEIAYGLSDNLSILPQCEKLKLSTKVLHINIIGL